MRKEYDFSKSVRNPYVKHLKQQITIRLDRSTVAYFKKLANETGVAYQVLINLFFKDCAISKKKPLFKWQNVA